MAALAADLDGSLQEVRHVIAKADRRPATVVVVRTALWRVRTIGWRTAQGVFWPDRCRTVMVIGS